MNDSTELANELAVPTAQGGVLSNVDQETLDFLTAPALSRNFLALAQGMTKETQETGIQQGEFFIANQDKTKSVPVGGMERGGSGKLQGFLDMVYLAWRPKAVLFIDNAPQLESYDPTSKIFNQIITTQEIKPGMGPKTIKPDWGTEVLVYIPFHVMRIDDLLTDKLRGLKEEDVSALRRQFSNGAVATFFFKGTNRENSFGRPVDRGGLQPGTAVQLRSNLIEGGKYQWWKTSTCRTLDEQNEEWMQTGRSLATQQLLDAFVNPPTQGGESVDDPKETDTAPIER